MGVLLALKAFAKALGNKEKAKKFLEDQPEVKKESIAPPKEDTSPSHLQLLMLLQKSGRLIDFLKEDISQFNDTQVGAAVRQIHQQCGEALEELVTIRPLMEEGEGQSVSIPQGYDPSEIKVVGQLTGEPPFKGVLRHKGWKAHKISLPKGQQSQKREVLCPAEVEVQ